jgi:beta-glucosidase
MARHTLSTQKMVHIFGYFLLCLVVAYGINVVLHTPIPEPLINPLYQNSDIPLEQRVADLLSHMSIEEKIGQMALVEKNSIDDLEDIRNYGIGGVLSGFGGRPENNTAFGWKQMVTAYDTESRSSRLGIPLLYGVDAIHGHSNVPGSTIFPHFIGLGATGNATLVEKVARVTGDELLHTGIRWNYSPTFDMPEDIRWGRVYESFSDDPLLVSKLGGAYIRGLQSNQTLSSSTISVLATPKHYIGAGGMLWGSSTNENFKIDQGVTPVNEEKLRTHYLPPFQKAIDAGALSVMVGLNSWGDTKLAASSHLIQTVLKHDLGFKCSVVSDWYGVYEIPGGHYRAVVTAINAGVDMVMLPYDYKEFTRNMLRAIKNHDIEESRINDAVTRILTAKFRMGLFDPITLSAAHEIGAPEHRVVARDAVAQSLVLLKNTNGALPIHKNTSLIRVAGSAADNIGKQVGAWTVEWQGIDGNWLPGATSILEGMRTMVTNNTKIEFDSSGNFDSHSKKADLGIAVVGESPYAEGWGDSPFPTISKDDLATIDRLREASEIIIVVLVTGRPLFITHELPKWDALVVAWLPGSEGGGVSDVLFGTKPFTGKLPLPWPSDIEQLPAVNGKTYNGTPPLFSRYFGLSSNI